MLYFTQYITYRIGRCPSQDTPPAGGWNEMIFKVTPKPTHSAIP